jgi:hypothetical protein
MIKLIKYLLLLVVLVSLVVSFTPLNLYYTKIAQNLKPIQLEQISGSAIKGSAQNIKYVGMDLGRIDWLAYPGSYNNITLDFNLNDNLYDISGKFIKAIDSEKLTNIVGTFDWKLIKNQLNFNRGEVSGYVELDFEHIELKNRVPEKIVGKVVTKELKLLKPIQKELGDIEIVFVSDNPSIIVGQVNSKSNVLNVSGAIYIHKNHRWEIKLTLIPLPGEYEIEYALQTIGDKRRGGGRSLNLAGFY